jgi:hypothetical protein
MAFTWIELERETIPEQQITWQYDEEGNPIPNTDEVFDYIMVNTLIEYYYPEYDTKVTINVTHFNPQTEADIELGINNMGVTEERKLENQ